MSFFTFQDALDHATDYLGGNPSDQVQRDCMRAVTSALRDLSNAFHWTYLLEWSRILTSPAFDGTNPSQLAPGNPIYDDLPIMTDPATLSYDHTGGTYERMVTLQAGYKWPSYAALGVIRVGQVGYAVDQRISDSVVTLDSTLNPGMDLAAGTLFQLYQDTYLLPADFSSQDQMLYERNFGGMDFTHPRDWLYENRYVFAQGIPQRYTITGLPRFPGRLVVRLYPWPFEFRSIDFIYNRRPRALETQQLTDGFVTTTQGSTTINGTGTTFLAKHVGCVLRLGHDTTPPTSLIMGSNPFVFESVITKVTSTTQIEVADAVDTTYTGVAYVASDPIDVEQGAMLNAYLRCIEKHLGMSRSLVDKPNTAAQYAMALREAQAADSRSFMGRAVNQDSRMRPRLRNFPIDLTKVY